jgi:hypothetical protein
MASEVAATATNQPTGAECRNRGRLRGETGRGFAVVADAVRTPVEPPAKTGQKTATVDIINSAITRLPSDGYTAESDNQSVVTSEANIRHVLDRLTTLRSACLARPYGAARERRHS